MRFFEAMRDMWQAMEAGTRMLAGYALIAFLLAALGWSTLAEKVSALERKRKAREAVVREMLPLKVAYRAARQSSEQMAGRMSALRPEDTLAGIVEEIAIKGRGVKISPLRSEPERAGMIEDAADVRMEGLTLNEAVNLLYRIEKGSRPLAMKKCKIHIRFDDPSRCDLSMILALLRPIPGKPG